MAFELKLCVSLILHFVIVQCKIYERCELARELYEIHKLPIDQIPTWVCIARHESEFNTSAINQGSGDHGLFQISQLFWCSPPGYACGVSCESLRDDNIKNDIICARRVFREHKRLSGDGFNAWVVYNQHCKSQTHLDELMEGCLENFAKTIPKENSEKEELPPVNYYPQFLSDSDVFNLGKKKTTTTEKTTKFTTTKLIETTNIVESTIKVDLEEKVIKSTTEFPKKIKTEKIISTKEPTTTPNYSYTISKTGFKFTKGTL